MPTKRTGRLILPLGALLLVQHVSILGQAMSILDGSWLESSTPTLILQGSGQSDLCKCSSDPILKDPSCEKPVLNVNSRVYITCDF